jgi:hypothetical protein
MGMVTRCWENEYFGLEATMNILASFEYTQQSYTALHGQGASKGD